MVVGALRVPTCSSGKRSFGSTRCQVGIKKYCKHRNRSTASQSHQPYPATTHHPPTTSHQTPHQPPASPASPTQPSPASPAQPSPATQPSPASQPSHPVPCSLSRCPRGGSVSCASLYRSKWQQKLYHVTQILLIWKTSVIICILYRGF